MAEDTKINDLDQMSDLNINETISDSEMNFQGSESWETDVNETLVDYRNDLEKEIDQQYTDDFIAQSEQDGLIPKDQEQPPEPDTSEQVLEDQPIGPESISSTIQSTAQMITPMQDTFDSEEDVSEFRRKQFSIGADIYLGFMQANREVYNGIARGINEILGLVDRLAEPLNEAMGLPQTDTKIQLPETDIQAPTVTGSLLGSISQFASGFGVAGRAMKSLGLAQGAGQAAGTARTITQGTIGDLLSFNEQEDRLSNIVEQIPSLQNPVTEFLATDESDTLATGKLKQALEGAGLGVAGEIIFKGANVLRKVRRVEESLPNNAQKTEQDMIAERMSILGDPNRDELVYTRKKTREKIKESEEIVSDLSPDDVMKAETRTGDFVEETDELVINLSRINSDEDIKKVIQEMSNNPQLLPGSQAERRGVRSNVQTLESAEDINGFNELMKRRTGEAFNAEQITASRSFYNYITEKVKESSQLAGSSTASKLDVFNFRKILAIHDATQKEFLGMRAEAGRALQAWSIPVDSQGVNTKAINEIINVYGGSDNAVKLAQRISNVESLSASSLNEITRKTAYARTSEAFREAWTLGLLTSPDTHFSNVLSTGLTGLAEIPKRGLQAMMSDSPVKKQEMFYLAKGMSTSFREAFSNSAKAFRTGQTGFSTGKIELPRQRATSLESMDPTGLWKYPAYAMDYYGRAVGIASRGLAAGDELMRTVLANGQAYALGARDGAEKGLKGRELSDYVNAYKQSPPESAVDSIKAFAEYNLFINQLGEIGQQGQRLISKVPSLRFVMPFVKAPTNIFKYGFEHTPLAFASSRIRDDISAGGLRRAEALSKIGMGTVLMQIGTDMSLKGEITGGGPSDPRYRRILQNQGWQPYSLKIGDTYYSYSRLEPIATLLGFSADMTDILTNYESYDMYEQEEVERMGTAVVAMMANQVIGKTFLQGVSDTIDVLSDPRRRGDAFINRYASSLVPSAIGKISRTLDPEARMVTNMMDAFKTRIPGLSKEVPRRRNIWGEEIPLNYPTVDSDVINFLNPIYMSKKKNSPIDQFMLENGFPLSMPSKIQSFDGTKIDLRETPEAYSRLLEIRGREIRLPQYGNGMLNMKDYLDELVTDNTIEGQTFFNTYNTYEKQETFLKKVVRDFTDAAKIQLLEENPDLEFELEIRREEQESKLRADPILENLVTQMQN